jgi:hypothetical protein
MQKTSELPETVNVFVGRKDTEEITKDATPFERYIISQNNTLHVDNKALTIEAAQLTARIEDLEGIEDRADTRASNLKGLLKNFHEVSKWQQETGEKRQLVIDSMRDDLRAYNIRLKFHTRILGTVLFVIAAFSFEFCSTLAFALVATCAFIVVPFQESSRLNLPAFSYDKLGRQIAALQKEIAKADKANDYIHEFLDSQ